LLKFKVHLASKPLQHMLTTPAVLKYLLGQCSHRTSIHMDRLNLKALIKHKYNQRFPILEIKWKDFGHSLAHQWYHGLLA